MKKLMVFAVLLSIISCTSNNSKGFEQMTPLKDHNWQRFNKINFEVPVKKNDSLDFYLVFQYNADFKEKRLPVNITFYTPGGETRSRNFSFWLVDRKTKKKLGTTENHKTTIILPIRKEMPFIANGMCKVTIEKKIPTVDNFGIEAVGLKAIKSISKKADNK